jgi:hypothetical protein
MSLAFKIAETVEVRHGVTERNDEIFWVGRITDSYYNDKIRQFEYFVSFSLNDGGWYTAADLVKPT